MTTKSILQIQQEIAGELLLYQADIEKTLFYLIDQGKQLPSIPAAYKTDAYLIKGCHSKVWLAAVLDKGLVYFYADSNTAITKGLISLLIRILNGRPPEMIAAADLFFIQENRMDRFIGNRQSNGFLAMISHMKVYGEQFLIGNFSELPNGILKHQT